MFILKDETVKNIADAIRHQEGSTEKIKPSEMDDRILALLTEQHDNSVIIDENGAGHTSGTLTNGTYHKTGIVDNSGAHHNGGILINKIISSAEDEDYGEYYAKGIVDTLSQPSSDGYVYMYHPYGVVGKSSASSTSYSYLEDCNFIDANQVGHHLANKLVDGNGNILNYGVLGFDRASYKYLASPTGICHYDNYYKTYVNEPSGVMGYVDGESIYAQQGIVDDYGHYNAQGILTSECKHYANGLIDKNGVYSVNGAIDSEGNKLDLAISYPIGWNPDSTRRCAVVSLESIGNNELNAVNDALAQYGLQISRV